MKKRILSTLFLAAAGVHASDALDADAQSRRDFVSKYAAQLVAGEARAVVAITAAMQVNGNRVIAYLCSDGGQRQTLALWSAQLLQAENYAPLAQHLAQLIHGEDGKQDASAFFNASDDDYRNARSLGCYTAALRHALQATADSDAHVLALLKQTGKAAGISDADNPPPDKARWVAANLAPALQAGGPAARLHAVAVPQDADPAAVAAFDESFQAPPLPLLAKTSRRYRSCF